MFVTLFREIKQDARERAAIVAEYRCFSKQILKTTLLFQKKHQCGIIWIKLSSVLFSFEEDVYLCNLYNHQVVLTVLTNMIN